jgi:hypothetical protein
MKKTNHSTTLGLSRHVGRSLNGSGEWLWWMDRGQREEGGTGVILPPAISPGWCYEPRLML